MNKFKNKCVIKWLQLIPMLLCLCYPTLAEGKTGYAGAETGPGGVLQFKPPSNTTTLGSKDLYEVGGMAMDEMRIWFSGISGIAAILLVGVFGYYAVQLAMFEEAKPGMRKTYIKNVVVVFIAIVLLGGASLISGLFYNLFQT